MTKISPLNEKIISSRLNSKSDFDNKTAKHDLAYKNLIVQSAVVKPNKAKAVLVKETFPQSLKNYTLDTIQDVKHFFTAAKTGKMDDNSLGRINDLGMKFGGLLIATYLATCKARTKTEALMQYIGGGAFFASMALWPKLFINLPAKLIHGFRIDQKYISAQGEKKDFFLDNQFLPWDAFSEDELRQNAKKAGIDYDSENGDEKIKRKMQKTALQNRTLWMATAGFATPLMTALFGDFIQPKVNNAVIKNGLKKSQSAMKNIDTVLNDAKPIVRNEKAVSELISQYQNMDFDEFLTKMSKLLTLDFTDVFKDVDDGKTISDFNFGITKEQLKSLRSHTSVIENNNIAFILENAIKSANLDAMQASQDMAGLFGKAVVEIPSNIKVSDTIINKIAARFNELDKKTLDNLLKIVNEEEAITGVDLSVLKSALPNADFKYDDFNFLTSIQDLNSKLLAQARGRLKEYLCTIVNPVIGRKDESVYTSIYRDAMEKALPQETKWIDTIKFDFLDKRIFKPIKGLKPVLENALKKISENENSIIGKIKVIDTDTLKQIKSAAKNLKENNGISEFYSVSAEAMSKIYQQIASIEDEEQYKTIIEQLLTKNDKDLIKYAQSIVDKGVIEKIFPQNLPFDKVILDEIEESFSEKLSDNIKSFADVANANISAIKSRVLVSINLERRIKSGEFKKALEEAGLISKENTLEDLIQKARYMVYRGTVASDACQMEFKNENLYKTTLTNILYNPKYYDIEKSVSSGLEETLNTLMNLGTKSKDNAYATGLAKLEAAFVTNILNNHAWKKIFVPATVALVAITLLVQPFFGNIKKEFPEKKAGGN